MATPSAAQAVKSLNKSPGRRRFVFKTFSQRIEEIDIDVYRSLDPLKSEPSQGSSFFLECLIQWRELNTAEDFISFYEEVMPLVQTLPQIILQKELIVSKLLSRLHMKARLSLEPVLRLIAALSRDLLEDFSPFLQRITDSLVSLLKSGADREPELIEQIFTSWSYIMMHLQKYLVRETVHVLQVTVKLRYYPKDYVQEFMAESVSFLLRNAPIQQLIKGIRKIMFEVLKKPLTVRKSGVSALLWYVMRGTSLRLHSRAEQVLRLLMDDSIYSIGDTFTEGSDTVVEVVIAAFQRLIEALEPTELKLMWDCLYEEINQCVTNGYLVHANRLLALLLSTVQIEYVHTISDYPQLLQLVGLLVQTFIVPCRTVAIEDQSCEIIDNVLQLMCCILDGLQGTNNMSALSSVSLAWAPVFELRNSSLLTFLKELLLKDPCILYTFRANIIRGLNDLIGTFEEEVIYLLLIFCERVQVQSSSLLDGTSRAGLSRICSFLQEAIGNWIGVINDAAHGGPSRIHFQETKVALLWGIINCYSFVVDIQANQSLLMPLVDALDQLLTIESDYIAGFPKNTWQSLIGAGLSSYNRLHSIQKSGDDESAVRKFLYLAKRYKSSSQILSSVADFLDSVHESTKENMGTKVFYPELGPSEVVDALDLFSENLCHSDKVVRLSTLRILCHYELLNCEYRTKDQPVEKKSITQVSQPCYGDDQGRNVLQLLLSIEATPLSINTSRKVILLISRIQIDLSAMRIPETYAPSVLNGIIAIFHNRFFYLWDPAMECLAVLISQYFGMVWDRCIHYLERCGSSFFMPQNKSDGGNTEAYNKSGDMVERFNSFVDPPSDSTPCATVLSLLLQSLQKVPSISESRSRQVIPLFLKFLGYDVDEIVSVKSYNSQVCKGKEWKSILKEWLNLLKLMRNPGSFYRSQFLKEVLEYRLLDDSDAELQMKVLDCLLNWKDDFLVPYEQHLKNLVIAKKLREELTAWNLSRESNLIDDRHRIYLVPIIIRIVISKVKKLKTLASRKHASIHHRKAVLRFLTQLDVDELPLFFALLIKPLQEISEGVDVSSNCPWSPPGSFEEDFDSSKALKHFTMDNINALSWKKRYGFLHVIEDIIVVFDELHISSFLDLLMGCVVRILRSCTSAIDSSKSNGLSLVENDSSFNLTINEDDGGITSLITTSAAMKQFKDLRTLCLKVISVVLSKYEDHNFKFEFWDIFFTSVKPLIDGFKQEGASSEKPSSLFSCFLTMSRSYKLVSLLHREKNLVPDIFSILTVTTASEAIVSCVLKFIENLLHLDSELDNEDDSIKRVLHPNLDALVSSLHCLFTSDNSTKRKLVKFPGESVLSVFKLLSKYIKYPSVAGKFIDILLPLLAKRPHNSEACVETLVVIRHIVPILRTESTAKILNTVSPLLISSVLDVRMSICEVLDTLAANDSSVLYVAKLLRDLNATSAEEVGAFDYDTIIDAYAKINTDFFYTVQEEHALVLLSHSVHDMSSDDSTLRQSAFSLLLSFVEFCGKILDLDVKSDQGCWTVPRIHRMINNFLLKHVGDAMTKQISIQKVWLELLREMVLRLPKVPNLKSFRALCSEDAEDFFYTITDFQMFMRGKALARLKKIISSDNLSPVILNKVFVPLLFNMLFDVQHGKEEHVRILCLEAIASISGCMDWNLYYALLIRCFREINLKPEKQKVLFRLISSILDHFHFSENHCGHESKDFEGDSKSGSIGLASSSVLHKSTSLTKLADIQTCIYKNMLPKVQKLLASASENVNANISLVALKLLKLVPGDIMELQLPNIIHRISNFLKSRLESIRDEARSALAACLKELGLEYLQFIVKVLRATLKRGYELHVLGYTLNFILSKCPSNLISGKLDYCLEELLSVAENDILGDVSEEKEVDKIASKMKETKKKKSFETLKLIAQNVTFKTHALKLLSPVTVHLQKQLTPKLKIKFETMLKNIAAGIECNASVDQADLFIFSYGLIKDGIIDEKCKQENSYSPNTTKQCRDEGSTEIANTDRLIVADPRCSHQITVFALGLMHSRMKQMKPHNNDEPTLSMLDPLVKLLCDCLSSKYEDIISGALRCLSVLVRLPLPSLENQADKIKTSLLVIAQGSVNASSPLMESCLKLLTVLLRNTSITLSTDQLYMLIQFPLFVDLERNPSFVALSLLKAVVNRKLVVHEIYDVVNRVAELMVTSQVEPIRKKCSQILLQFLLDYRLSEKRLQQHLDFLLANLRYEHATGREAVLEMLHAIIVKFPKNVLDEQCQTIFIHFVVCLANDHDNRVRSMTGAAIKLLIGRVTPHSLHLILEYTLSWYLGGKQHLWSAAAQVLGLLVEVMKTGFQRHISCVLPVMRTILQSSVNIRTHRMLDLSNEETVPYWREAYYSLVMLEKMLHQFHDLCLGRDLEDIWETICDLLLHPHMWLRNISSRLVALYFATVTKASRENCENSAGTFFLMKPNRLFLIAISLCCQLKVQLTDDSANTLITQNLVFAICGLHSLAGQNDMDPQKFWSMIEHHEQARYVKVLDLVDLRNGRGVFTSLASGFNSQNYQENGHHYRYVLVTYLLKRMGKISLQMETIQMKIVFNSFKSIAPKILNQYAIASQNSEDYCQTCAHQMLLPLYKVSEGFAGKTIPDDVKQLAQKVCDSIRNVIGMQNFVQIYSQIQKNLKSKRDKRKQEEKLMAVVNPTRNAKRKLRIAAKHRVNKKRKITTMRMGKWMR